MIYKKFISLLKIRTKAGYFFLNSRLLILASPYKTDLSTYQT